MECEMIDLPDGSMIAKPQTFDPAKSFGERYKMEMPNHSKEALESVSYQTDSDYFYNMKSYPRGKLFIFNMNKFKENTGLHLHPRNGTEKDVEQLAKVFLSLGFTVERFEDLSKTELLKTVAYISSDDFSHLACFVCVFLTHGQQKIIYATDGYVEISKLTRMFTGSNLAGKPKVFLIQACRGDEYMEGIDVVDGGVQKHFSLPVEADFLFAYATPKGFYSWRNSETGSWFIQELCKVFREEAKNMDVMRMLTRVNRALVNKRSRSNDIEISNKRQIGCIVSQLRKELYFFPPG